MFVSLLAFLALGPEPVTVPEWQKMEAKHLKKVKKKRKYVWDFDPYFDIFESTPDGEHLKRLTKTDGYDAEGSYSADGKSIVFCSNRSGKDDLELYIMDADGKNVRPLTKAPG